MIPTDYIVALTLLLVFSVVLFFFHRAIQKRNKLIAELRKEQENIKTQKKSATDKLENITEIKEELSVQLEHKQNELISFALNIVQKNTFLEELKLLVNQIKSITNQPDSLSKLNQLSIYINQHIALDKNRKLFQLQLEEANREFYIRLTNEYPNLTEKEKRLAAYIRLNLTSKEIASLLNIATKSVEINRYRLRKKFGLDAKTNLSDFIRQL